MIKRDIKTMYNLPESVRYCKKCVITNQRPRIVFDSEGICNACRYAERKKDEIDWEKRGQELIKLCNFYRSKKGNYDVIVPASGGKDSAFVAHTLKHEMKMHPLTVTWAPLSYTDIGWSNFQNFIQAGYDNILGTPNGKVSRILTRLSFVEMGEPFQPFIYGQMAFPLKMAVLHKIPLIFYGENGEAEYGGDIHNEDACKYNLDTDLEKHCFSNKPPSFWKDHGLKEDAILPFQSPTITELKEVGIEAHFMGYYKFWAPQENYYTASLYTGFKPNPDGRSEGTYSKYASLDDKFDGFHYYLMFCKFGIGRATSDAAHEIRDGHITREEAVSLVKKYDGEFPKKYFKDFLEYIEMKENEFWKVVDSWRAEHLWEKVEKKWRLKFPQFE